MSIQGFGRGRRTIGVLLSVALMAATAGTKALARGDEGAIRITAQNVRFEADAAIISYDLDVPEGTTCVVKIELRRANDPNFIIIPSSLTGDFGELKTPGPHRTIRWEYAKDVPAALKGDDYYFTIGVERPGGFPWLWVGIGSAAVAGTAIAVMSHKSSPAGAQPGVTELPMPPAR